MSEAQQPEATLVKADPERVSNADLHRHEMSYFRGVMPSDPMNKMWAFAQAIKDSSFVPTAAKGDAGSVFLMINRAAEMGLNWTVAVNGGLYPIPKYNDDGTVSIRLGIEGHAALSLLLGRKFKCEILQSDEKVAEWRITRPDDSFSFSDSFTITEANNLGLLKKKNWAYPKDMLRWRAFMRVARIVAADVLGGVYLPEELEAVDMESTPSGWKAANADKSQEQHLEEMYTVGRKPEATVQQQATPQPEPKPEPAPKEEPKPDVPSRDTEPEPKKSNVVEMDPLRASVTDRFNKIIADVPLPRRRGTSKLSDEEQAKKDRADRSAVIHTYMKAYFGVETLKEVAAHIQRAHEAMDQWSIAFANNPEITCKDPAGIAREQAADRVAWERLMEELVLNADDAALAWKVKVAMQHATDDQAQYFKALDIPSLSAVDLTAFLRLAATDKRQAGKLLNLWRGAKASVSFWDVVRNIEEKEGGSLESVDPEKLSKRVAQAIDIIQERIAEDKKGSRKPEPVTEPEPEPQPQPETSASEEVDGLLFGEGA